MCVLGWVALMCESDLPAPGVLLHIWKLFGKYITQKIPKSVSLGHVYPLSGILRKTSANKNTLNVYEADQGSVNNNWLKVNLVSFSILKVTHKHINALILSNIPGIRIMKGLQKFGLYSQKNSFLDKLLVLSHTWKDQLFYVS